MWTHALRGRGREGTEEVKYMAGGTQMNMAIERVEIKSLYSLFYFNTKNMIASVCVACERNNLQLCFHLGQRLLIALTSEIILNRLIMTLWPSVPDIEGLRWP